MKPQRKDNPSSIFYWKDYENDESLRISSLAAQGIWMRLLCIAAKADPYGYILVNGFPLEATGAARLAGVTEGEAQSLLQELERNGVFSRDRKGRMFSRRMVRDAAVRAKAQKNGAKGGNPQLGASSGKQTAKHQSVNPPVNHPLKPPYPLPHSPEEYGGGGVREGEKTVREMILETIGVDPVSGLTGRGGKMLGTQADMAEVARWLDLPGITVPIILAEVRRTMAGKRDGPPSSFRFFSPAMQRLSGELSRPSLDPIIPSPTTGAKHDRQRFDQAINAVADGLTAGTIGLGLEDRDPFATQRRGNA